MAGQAVAVQINRKEIQTMFEEYEAQFPPNYGDKRDLTERAFSKDPQPGLKMEIKKQSPKLYSAMQAEAQKRKYIGETKSQWVQRLAEVQKPAAPKRLDDDEQISTTTFSEAEIDRILGNQGVTRDAKGQLTVSPDNLVQMKKSEPMKAYFIKMAAHVYGKALNRPTKPTGQTKPATESESTFELAPELCTTFNVAPKTFVTLTEFADLSVKHHEKVKAEAEKVAAVAVAAEAATK
jgi:hypothetical protein